MLFYAWMKWIRQALYSKSMYFNSLINFFCTPFPFVIRQCVFRYVCFVHLHDDVLQVWQISLVICNGNVDNDFNVSGSSSSSSSAIQPRLFSSTQLCVFPCDSAEPSKLDALIFFGFNLKWKYNSTLEFVLISCVTWKWLNHFDNIFVTLWSASKLIESQGSKMEIGKRVVGYLVHAKTDDNDS